MGDKILTEKFYRDDVKQSNSLWGHGEHLQFYEYPPFPWLTEPANHSRACAATSWSLPKTSWDINVPLQVMFGTHGT